MKKIIACLVIAGSLAWVFVGNNPGPYSGEYNFKQNPNLVLRINNNNTFAIYNVVGKTTGLIEGKYTIDNNNLTLVPNNENLDKFISKPLTGKVEGSIIKVAALNGEFVKEK
jgi:hypothetical protein